MADRSVSKQYTTKGMDRLRVPIADGETLPIGTLVQEESGFANHWDGTNTFLGIVLGGENLSSAGLPVGLTSLAPDPAVYIDTSGVVMEGIAVNGASTVAVIGEFVYCEDSNLDNATVTQPTTIYPIGYIVGWRSASDVDVKLFTPSEHLVATTAPGSLGGDWS